MKNPNTEGLLPVLWFFLKGMRMKHDLIDGDTGNILLLEGRKVRKSDLKKLLNARIWERLEPTSLKCPEYG